MTVIVIAAIKNTMGKKKRIHLPLCNLRIIPRTLTILPTAERGVRPQTDKCEQTHFLRRTTTHYTPLFPVRGRYGLALNILDNESRGQ
ncbi:hypothetical protein CEXT_371131 [Caerostris extrusa]|uniref:Uncharacterized protein n=1 Tax=Caerostris extrusa TaxID=172846 RepID=A0AAV4XRV9_CAEEX|nr:hypothetical protein CEXT_371131 [Caerostris extrusa]